MQLNPVIVTLCLLGAVALCGGQRDVRTDPPLPPTVRPTSAAPTSLPPRTITTPGTGTTVPGTGTTEPGTATTEPGTGTTEPGTGTTVPGTGTTEPGTGTPVTDPITTQPVEEVPPGLSDGAIAGITIGSIAGVAAVGGGIFGLLKFTGRV